MTGAQDIILPHKLRGLSLYSAEPQYVGASFPDPAVGNAKDGPLQAFIPDPADPDKLEVGTPASGIAADDAGNIYAADVAAHNLRKYVKVR